MNWEDEEDEIKADEQVSLVESSRANAALPWVSSAVPVGIVWSIQITRYIPLLFVIQIDTHTDLYTFLKTCLVVNPYLLF